MSDGAASVEARPHAVTAAVAIVGCGALAARFALVSMTPRPATALLLLFGVLLLCGSMLPLGATRGAARPSDRPTQAAVAIVGVAAFVAARVLTAGHAPLAISGYAIVTSSLAAVAEEAFFRRLVYGLLEPAGPAFAIAGSTLLFAMVHVAAYGWWVLPLDLAAGALFGWQRRVSGSWVVPAITHVVANLVVLL